MTDGRPAGAWTDERLDAAFSARAAASPPTPADLLAATTEAVRATAPRTTRSHGVEWLAGLAAAVAVALIAGTGLVLRPASPQPASTLAGPTQSGISPAASSPAGLLPISVSAAVAIRDGIADDREIQVRGWIRRGVPVPCPAVRDHQNPAAVVCPPAVAKIVEQTSDAGLASLNELPAGPWLQPSFALVDADLPELQPGAVSPAAPVEITVTGHFHDRRAPLCGATDCASTFVVDRIDSIGAVPMQVSTSSELAVAAERGNTISPVEIPPPPTPANQYDAVFAPPGSGLTVLSRRVMSVDGLIAAEPELAAGWLGIGTATVVTTLTVLDPGSAPEAARSRTFLVPAGSSDAYEVTPGGLAVAGNLPPQPAPEFLVGRVGGPITVSEAIDHRDHALDDTELLVAGYAWAPGPLFCTLVFPGMPVLDQCPSTLTWIAEREPPAPQPGSLIRPTGPALNLVVPPESANLANIPRTPTRIAVLGHFDDRRSGTCPPDKVERCRRNFIVDMVLDPKHLALDTLSALSVHPAPSNTPRGNASWAASVAGLPEADRTNRLISAFPIAVAALRAFEPGTDTTQAMSNVDTVWLVHFLDSGPDGKAIVRTRLVVDGVPGDGVPAVYDVIDAGLARAMPAAR